MHFIRDGNRSLPSKTGASNAAYPCWGHHSCGGVCLTFICHHSPLGLGPLASSPLPPHLAGIKKLLSGNLVTGFKLDSQADPDPVCEACKAGKMHADPFPNSTSRASKPLQLVHSDVHGPVKVPTHQGIAIGSLSLMTSLASRLFTS
jgi:hypothetical protein